jgi:hypothetical protein
MQARGTTGFFCGTEGEHGHQWEIVDFRAARSALLLDAGQSLCRALCAVGKRHPFA